MDPHAPHVPTLPRRRMVLAIALCAAPGTARVHARAAASPLPPIEGIAIGVHDGDSFVLHAGDGRRLRVRIAGIDAPERQQPFSEHARRRLGELLRDRPLRIEPIKQDVYGRTIARVTLLDGAVPGRDAGLAMLESGSAWHFERYRADQSADEFARYAEAQRRARLQSAGLWREASPEPPWAFRSRMRRHEAAPPRRSPPPPPAG
jgi:endonuclease YncB( thermonuclease family)